MIKALRPTIITTGVVTCVLFGYTVLQHTKYTCETKKMTIESHKNNELLLADAKIRLKKAEQEIDSIKFEIQMRTDIEDWVKPIECPVKLSNF